MLFVAEDHTVEVAAEAVKWNYSLSRAETEVLQSAKCPFV